MKTNQEILPSSYKSCSDEKQDGLLRQQEIFQQLIQLLEEKNIYLNPDLTLVMLSSELGTNTTYASRVINQHFHCNFRTLLKRYRIAYSQKLLEESDVKKKINGSELARLCGFKSRSSFYAAFQELVRLTPKDYQLLVQVGKLKS